MVMAGHRHSKNGVASLAYNPAIHVFDCSRLKGVNAATIGHDDELLGNGPSWRLATQRQFCC